MRAALLSIGTELVRGEIVDTNSAHLAARLTEEGHEVLAADTVADDLDRIVTTLRRLGDAHDAIVCTGGLGPTTDDLTTVAAANAIGVGLQRDPASLAVIRARMERFGRVMADSNAKQADFPIGATLFPNPHGTAPGFEVRVGTARAFFLPGVPREMKPMFETHVLPALRAEGAEISSQIRLRTFGLPESTVNDRLAGVEAAHGIVLGYRAHFPEIEVKVLGRGAPGRALEQRVRAAADAVRRLLGEEVVFGEGETSLGAALGEELRARALTIATAESCTGGQCASLLTADAGSSAYFAGGVVCYSNTLKTTLLGVPEALLAEHGAVSEPVARAMAEGARRRLGVGVAVATTGIAGPSGATETKPVGLVHLAVATATGVDARQLGFPGSRDQVQRLAAFAALRLARDAVRALPRPDLS